MGWRDDSVILCRTDEKRPWLGVIISEFKAKAHVRQTFFDEIEPNLLLEILSAIEGNFGKISGFSNETIWKALTREAGLIDE